MNDRDELTTAILGKTAPRAADAILAAGYRKPGRVNTHEELAALPDGTVIRDWNGLVGEKRDWPLDLAVRYVDGTQEANRDIDLPATVLYIPEESVNV